MLELMYEPRNASPLLEVEWAIIAGQLGFSPRELQIVRHVMDDAKEKTIARRLGISVHTVHTHLKRVYAKRHVTSRVELILQIFREYVAYARRDTVNRPHESTREIIMRKAA